MSQWNKIQNLLLYICKIYIYKNISITANAKMRDYGSFPHEESPKSIKRRDFPSGSDECGDGDSREDNLPETPSCLHRHRALSGGCWCPKCLVDPVPLPRHPAGSPLGSPLHRQQLRREPVLGGAHRPGAGQERAAARRLHCSVLLQVRVCRGKCSGHNTAFCRREHLLPGSARQQTSIILQGEAARPGTAVQ